MDYQPCQPCHPASSYAPGVVRPRRNAIRYFVVGLMTATLVLLVYGIISAHLRTEHRVHNLQSELHLINRELSRMIDRYGDDPPAAQHGTGHHHHTHRTVLAETADNSSLQMHQLEALVRKHTATLQKELAHTSTELHRLRSGVDAMKVGAALSPHAHTADRMDYALESIGGSVEHTGSSRLPNSLLAILTRTLSLNAPRRIIQPTAAIGECFGFYGNDGEVVVRLQQRVFVEAVSIDHIRSEMAPRGSVNSAPKEFAVYGVVMDEAAVAAGKEDFLGTYEYKIGAVRPMQVFEIPESLRSKNSHGLVRFKFMSNHGNEEYTCVYQVKVHGRPDDSVGRVHGHS